MLELPQTSASPVETYLEKVRYRRTTPNSLKELYTPCYLCDNVVREGSRRFDALELVHKHTAHLSSLVKM